MISILTPTRNRPVEIQRMVESAIETATGEIEFLFRMDSDDRTEHALGPQRLKSGKLARLFTLNGPRERMMTKFWNDLLPHANGDILLQGNDDIVFRTNGWDALVQAEFDKVSDKILLVGGDDGMNHGRAIPHPFVSRKWVDTVGYFIAPYFESDYGDTWLEQVSMALGRRVYLPNVLIEHFHFIFGKAQKDQTTLERLARHSQQNPAKLYAELAPKRAEDVAKLRAVIMEHYGPAQQAASVDTGRKQGVAIGESS